MYPWFWDIFSKTGYVDLRALLYIYLFYVDFGIKEISLRCKATTIVYIYEFLSYDRPEWVSCKQSRKTPNIFFNCICIICPLNITNTCNTKYLEILEFGLNIGWYFGWGCTGIQSITKLEKIYIFLLMMAKFNDLEVSTLENLLIFILIN